MARTRPRQSSTTCRRPTLASRAARSPQPLPTESPRSQPSDPPSCSPGHGTRPTARVHASGGRRHAPAETAGSPQAGFDPVDAGGVARAPSQVAGWGLHRPRRVEYRASVISMRRQSVTSRTSTQKVRDVGEEHHGQGPLVGAVLDVESAVVGAVALKESTYRMRRSRAPTGGVRRLLPRRFRTRRRCCYPRGPSPL